MQIDSIGNKEDIVKNYGIMKWGKSFTGIFRYVVWFKQKFYWFSGIAYTANEININNLKFNI